MSHINYYFKKKNVDLINYSIYIYFNLLFIFLNLNILASQFFGCYISIFIFYNFYIWQNLIKLDINNIYFKIFE